MSCSEYGQMVVNLATGFSPMFLLRGRERSDKMCKVWLKVRNEPLFFMSFFPSLTRAVALTQTRKFGFH